MDSETAKSLVVVAPGLLHAEFHHCTDLKVEFSPRKRLRVKKFGLARDSGRGNSAVPLVVSHHWLNVSSNPWHAGVLTRGNLLSQTWAARAPPP